MTETRKNWNTPYGLATRPLTPARRALFLKVLAETGCYRSAARAATPHSTGKASPGVSSFKALENRDATFRAAVDDAIEEAKAAVEMEIKRRGQDGWLDPVFGKGERVYQIDPETGKQVPATIRRYDSNLLLARARALMPEKYSERKQLEISGSVTHVGCLITPQDVAQLSPDLQASLASVLRQLAINRGESDEHELPMIDVTPEPAKPEPLKLGRQGFTSKKPPGNRIRKSSPHSEPAASAKKAVDTEPSGGEKHQRSLYPEQAQPSHHVDSVDPEAWELLG
ncbi:MAG: hypothetical protein GEU87_02390 [Alphaproteobacteria bacterium]|nr:hypothetical protein [Alphaproteobacteria bacterium]